MLESLRIAVSVSYVLVLAALSVFAAHRLFLLLLLVRHARRDAPPPTELEEWPRVTVQLPLYDEAAVAARLVEAAGALDYPRDRLEIQVLDDSTDETTAIVAARVSELRSRGIDVSHVRRAERAGFKAGALAHGLTLAKGELVAIFDADFVPAPDFLVRIVPRFADEKLGLVQARWEHANRGASLLTRLQAILLDGHFRVEQAARSASGRPFNFNGTAGVFRRAAIVDAGGWSSDTLTEDLDLSIRAQLAGWRFLYVDDVAAPGELPDDLAAYRSQQRRWVKGSAQTARKLLGKVWSAKGHPLRARLETTFQLTLNASYPLALALALLAVPLVALGSPRDLPFLKEAHSALFVAAVANVAAFFVASQWRRGKRAVLEAIVLLPLLFALGLGLSLSNARAFLEGLAGRTSKFVRTPKRGALPRPRYVARVGLGEALLEVLIGGYLSWGFVLAVSHHRSQALPFLALLMAGFLGVGLKALISSFKPKSSVTISPA